MKSPFRPNPEVDSQDFSGFCVVGSSLHSVLDVDPVVVGLTPGHEGFTAIEKKVELFDFYFILHFKGLGGDRGRVGSRLRGPGFDSCAFQTFCQPRLVCNRDRVPG